MNIYKSNVRIFDINVSFHDNFGLKTETLIIPIFFNFIHN